MGIQGLLPFVKNAITQVSIDDFRGQTVAVDVSCWLHRGVFASSDQIARGKEADLYIAYCLRHLKPLLAAECRVILVFDGRPLPAKKEINARRQERRSNVQREAERLITEGKHREAAEKLKTATKITFDIVRKTLESFRTIPNVSCLVAPYEADAQLTYLEKAGYCDLVISEDSDLIPFGCQKVLFKYDPKTATGNLYERAKLSRCFSGTGMLTRNDDDVEDLKSTTFDFEKFRRICILAGCDYLPEGLAGVGLVKASKFFQKTGISDLRKVLPRIPRYLNITKGSAANISKEFIETFIIAEQTFLRQVVFDPLEKRQRSLTEVDQENLSNYEDFAGHLISDGRLVMDLAVGNIRDVKSDPIDNYHPEKESVNGWSIWDPDSSRKILQKSSVFEKASSTGAFEFTPVQQRRSFAPRRPKFKSPKKVRNSSDDRDMICKIYGLSQDKDEEDVDNDVLPAARSEVCSPYFGSGSEDTAMLERPPKTKFHNPFKKPRIDEEKAETPEKVANTPPLPKSPASPSLTTTSDKIMSGANVGDLENTPPPLDKVDDEDIVVLEVKSSTHPKSNNKPRLGSNGHRVSGLTKIRSAPLNIDKQTKLSSFFSQFSYKSKNFVSS